jgi:hypothetical protein
MKFYINGVYFRIFVFLEMGDFLPLIRSSLIFYIFGKHFMKTNRVLIWITCATFLIEAAMSCACFPVIFSCSTYDCADTLGAGFFAICGCYTCSSGYYRTPGRICDDCPSKYANCITCSISTCLTCQATYAVDMAGTCTSCSSFNTGCTSCILTSSPE